MTLVLEGPRRSHSSVVSDADQEAKRQLNRRITANGHANGHELPALAAQFEHLKVDTADSNGAEVKHDRKRQISERACLIILALSHILKNDSSQVDLAGQMLAHRTFLQAFPSFYSPNDKCLKS